MYRAPFTVQLCLAALLSLAMMAGFCSALIFIAQNIVIKQSRLALKDQTDVITLSLIKSAGTTFEAQMKIGVSALLMPLANILRDADSGTTFFRKTPFPYSPLNYYFDPNLKPPLTSEDDDDAVSFPGIMQRRFATNSISKLASANWLTDQYNRLAPDSPGVTGFLNATKIMNAEVLNKTGYMDYFSPKMWESNPEFTKFYTGAPSKVSTNGLFRAYPGYNLSPSFCGAMWDTPYFFRTKLYPFLNDDLIIISNNSIKGVDIKNKKILTVNSISVSSRADVSRALETNSNEKILVTWWQYDPRERGWYSGGIARSLKVMSNIDWATEITKGVYFGGPYKSASTGKWQISASKAVFPQHNCKGGAPECGKKLNSMDPLGVISFDMFIPVLNSITSKIRSRESGEGHLFHMDSGLVVSSPQWVADYTSSEMKMADVFINTATFGEHNVRLVSNADGGYFTYDDSTFSWVKVLDERYAVIIQTPLEELHASINGKLTQIRSSTEVTFWELMIVCVLCFLLIGGFITLLGFVAVPLLKATGKEAERVVVNLGGDLFSGVRDDIHGHGTGCAGRLGGLAEVTMLWTGFHSMLEMLAAKRLKKGSRDESNPIFMDDEVKMALAGWSVPWDAKDCRLQVQMPVEKTRIQKELKEEIREVHIPFWSSAIWRIMAFVGIPFIIGLAVALGLSTFTVRKNVDEWLSPIRKTLTDEERATLPIRLDAAADTLSFLFRRHENSLRSYSDLLERVWNSGFDHYPSGHSSSVEFSGSAERVIYPNFLWSTITTDEWVINPLPPLWPYSHSIPGGGHESTRVGGEIQNYWTAGYYGNLNNYLKSGWESPLLAANWSIRQSEQEVISLADPFTRELYFANDLTDIYVGFENTESFRKYPFHDNRYLITWKGSCVRDIPINDWDKGNLFNRSGYTPLCRGWYERARQLNGEVAYNGIDVSASNGLLYLALSVAVKNYTGEIFGVAAVEASLDELFVALSETILVTGYLFLGDLDGSLIIHPQLASSEKASIKDIEFECDGSFFENHWANIIALESGMYEHEKCGETYLIYWKLVENTEYISFLTVPLSDTEVPAGKVREEVSKTIEIMVGLCVGLSLPLGVGILLMVSWMMSSSLKNLARAVNEIAVAPENNIILPLPRFFHSSEVAMILKNIKRLLAALRFGNWEWSKSKPDLELRNILELEEIMVELDNLNGLGVVQNNHANILRQMASKRKNEASDLLSRAVTLYKLAIKNAINFTKMENGDLNPPVSYKPSIEITNLKSESINGKVPSRMLGLALVYMDQSILEANMEKLREALDIFGRVLEIYDKDENWKGLAILGYLITSHKISGERPTIFYEIVKSANSKSQKGLKKYAEFSGKLIPSDYSAVFKLCYNIWWYGGDINYILWPLLNIPQTPKALLYQFALAVLQNKSEEGRIQQPAKTGFTGSGIEGEGERYTPGQPVASAPALRLDTFGEPEENEGNCSGTRPS